MTSACAITARARSLWLSPWRLGKFMRPPRSTTAHCRTSASSTKRSMGGGQTERKVLGAVGGGLPDGRARGTLGRSHQVATDLGSDQAAIDDRGRLKFGFGQPVADQAQQPHTCGLGCKYVVGVVHQLDPEPIGE
jgi:hypothetical protein